MPTPLANRMVSRPSSAAAVRPGHCPPRCGRRPASEKPATRRRTSRFPGCRPGRRYCVWGVGLIDQHRRRLPARLQLVGIAIARRRRNGCQHGGWRLRSSRRDAICSVSIRNKAGRPNVGGCLGATAFISSRRTQWRGRNTPARRFRVHDAVRGPLEDLLTPPPGSRMRRRWRK